MKKLFISLDGGKKLSLGEIDTFSGRSFRLRTVDKNQYQARINLGLSDGYQSDSLHSAYLENLKSSANGFSYLDCMLKRDGNRLNLTIKNQSLTVCSDSFSLIPLKKRILFVLIPLFALLFLAGMISILLLSDFSLSAGTKKDFFYLSSVSSGATDDTKNGTDCGSESATAGKKGESIRYGTKGHS